MWTHVNTSVKGTRREQSKHGESHHSACFRVEAQIKGVVKLVATTEVASLANALGAMT